MAEKNEVTKEIEKETKEVKKLFGNYWAISTIVLALLLIAVLATNYGYLDFGKKKIGDNAITFFNTQLSSTPGTLKEVKQVNGVYQVMVEIQGKSVPVYFTKEGDFIAQGNGLIPITGESINQNTETQTQDEIPKTDKPKVDLYVMSFCPYGNLAENTMLPVYNLLKDKADFNVHYIVSVSGTAVDSLHGQTEVDQDEREACVIQNYGQSKLWVFMTYVNKICGSDGSCWETAAKESGVDIKKINDCVSSNGLNLMKQNEQESTAAGASGSPTLVINGVQTSEVYNYGDSDAYKDAICSAFNTAPAECSTKLASTESTASGSCN